MTYTTNTYGLGGTLFSWARPDADGVRALLTSLAPTDRLTITTRKGGRYLNRHTAGDLIHGLKNDLGGFNVKLGVSDVVAYDNITDVWVRPA